MVHGNVLILAGGNRWDEEMGKRRGKSSYDAGRENPEIQKIKEKKCPQKFIPNYS